jgi:hypothetical protein
VDNWGAITLMIMDVTLRLLRNFFGEFHFDSLVSLSFNLIFIEFFGFLNPKKLKYISPFNSKSALNNQGKTDLYQHKKRETFALIT